MPVTSEDTIALFVEDNVSNYVLMARLLNQIGLKCEWKTSGYEVNEYANTLPRVDLILMDIRLPYEVGYEALRKLRTHEKFAEIPIVAVTAFADPAEMQRVRAEGFDGFLGKPIDPDRFTDQVLSIIQGESVWEIG